MFCHNHEAITTLSPMPGQAALRGESGRHCPGRGLLRLPLHRRAAGRCCFVSTIAGLGVTCKLARHMTAASILRYFRSMLEVVRRAAALGCCAWQPRCVPFLVEGHCLASFCHEGRYFSPLHEGLALCFARHKPKFAHVLVGFRSVTPCCLYCFDFGYRTAVTRSVFVCFRA